MTDIAIFILAFAAGFVVCGALVGTALWALMALGPSEYGRMGE